MDVDLMKSSSSSGISGDHQEHIDMMTMMMQMERLPDFCNEPYVASTTTSASATATATPTLQEIHFSNGSLYPNQQPTLLNPSSIPFMGTTTSTPIQESVSLTPLSLQPSMVLPPPKFKYPPPFSNANSFLSSIEKKNSTAAIREMIFRIAAMQPIHIDPESIKPPKRRNVKISKDPQSVAARHRRERISERIRILQRLVPGGTKMDTASMLDEAIHYVKFLKKQVQSLEQAGANRQMVGYGFPAAGTGVTMSPTLGGFSSLVKNCQPSHTNVVSPMQMLR